MTRKPSEQARDRLQVEWLLFSLNKNTLSREAGQKLQNLAV